MEIIRLDGEMTYEELMEELKQGLEEAKKGTPKKINFK